MLGHNRRREPARVRAAPVRQIWDRELFAQIPKIVSVLVTKKAKKCHYEHDAVVSDHRSESLGRGVRYASGDPKQTPEFERLAQPLGVGASLISADDHDRRSAKHLPNPATRVPIRRVHCHHATRPFCGLARA